MGASPSKDKRATLLERSQKRDYTSDYDNNTLDNPSFTEDDESMNSPSAYTDASSLVQSKADAKRSTPRKGSSAAAKAMAAATASHGMKLNGNGLAFPGKHSVGTDAPSSYIADDEVHVNLAMADLMAYLQVVANNSNNLPLTRRDDPELGRTVSALTADEYARKSAAFIPADVRVIGGSFTKYGRVWDLPTSEEYNASDGAQEPGRSYGGACCNAMLKVLYDAANEAADAANDMATSEALFDDDDDESAILGKPSEMERNRTFASLVLGDVSNQSTITWAELLRKMKAEIQEIEYAQAPTITSTRKFDLNKPFSLIPDDFDPAKGKKRSLLIGCNYTNVHGAELAASHDDIRSMKDYIVNVHGFPETKGLMTVLLDDDKHKHPTHLNITEALKALSEQSQPGDAIFIQFSGHGGRVLDSPIDSEAESYDEAIVPSDYTVSGLIRDTLIFKTLLAPMRYGVSVTILIDCCDTGMMLDLPYAWTTKTDRSEALAKMSLNDDFSFVRFLKVVKTLYESSIFTQLGKTVGSALNNPARQDVDDETLLDEEDETLGNGSLETMGEDEGTLSAVPAPKKNSLFNALTACASPEEAKLELKKEQKDFEKGQGIQRHDTGTVDTRETRAHSQTLLEQVISCTLGHDAEESDEDTYHPRTVDDEHSYGTETLEETTTYDSMTDDGYESQRGRRRGRPRNRR